MKFDKKYFLYIFVIFIIIISYFYFREDISPTSLNLNEIFNENVYPRILLFSASDCTGNGFLVGCENDLKYFFRGIDEVLFIPYASYEMNSYEKETDEAFKRFGKKINSIHKIQDKKSAILNAKAIYIGGGNTFLLKKRLEDENIIPYIREAVFKRGVRYMGSSAGSNVACPTIMTTNDMPIVQPHSYSAINLVPFQINPHFISADDQKAAGYPGETRQERIKEYHDLNNTMVLGIPERTCIWIEGQKAYFISREGRKMTVFKKLEKPYDIDANTDITQLILKKNEK